MKHDYSVLIGLVVLASATTAFAAGDLFDPARHMRVSEVKTGMEGYGLSVFKGTKIERFEVKVVAVLKNFTPKTDMVLIECKGANLEHTGAIQGMSGSPVFLKDEQGAERMIGAFAFGWPLMKDPIAGVQPIEYMLGMKETKEAGGAKGKEGAVERKIRWSLEDCRGLLAKNDRIARRMTVPVMTNIPSAVVKQFSELFEAQNLLPLQSGGATGVAKVEEAKIEPGSVLGVPLITGDIEMTAIGTCTEVIGERVFGFGHAFNNEGSVRLPMGSGQIHAVIPNISSSFKLGALTKLRGTLTNDHAVGVAGRLGDAPKMIPMELSVAYSDGSGAQVYKCNAAAHPRLTPLITSAAIQAALSSQRELPQHHTLDYKLDLEFANGQTITLDNRAVNTQGQDLFFEIGTPISAAAENPFERVMLSKVTGSFKITPEARDAKILSINLPKTKYQPGETAKMFVTYRPFRDEEKSMAIEFEIPRDLTDGTYQLFVMDWDGTLEQDRALRPFRYTAETATEMFDVLRDAFSIKKNAMYVRLLRQADGVAIGRAAMPRLPSSRRQILLGAGLSNTTAFMSSAFKAIPTEYVMDGNANFAITVERDAKVEGGTTKTPRAGEKPAVTPTPKVEETKPKPNSADNE